MIYLVMIVKNEARGIRKTIESVQKYVDVCVIVDTGSIDDTQRIVLDMGCSLANTPFVDFATTRNVALNYAPKGAWRLMLSGDAVMEHAERLPEIIDLAEKEGCNGVDITTRSGGLEYDQAILTRYGKYEGVTHEAMIVDGKTLPGRISRELGLVVHYEGEGDDRTARWQLDCELLEKEIKKNRSPRTLFYLAQTFECLGDYKRAINLYRERAALDTFPEESFMAQLRLARCVWRLGQDPVQEFLKAYEMRPSRAEPLCEASRYLRLGGRYALAVIFADVARKIAFPVYDRLFIESEVYAWQKHDEFAISAYYVGRHEEAIEANGLLLKVAPPHELARIQTNLDFSKNRV